MAGCSLRITNGKDFSSYMIDIFISYSTFRFFMKNFLYELDYFTTKLVEEI